MVIGINPGYGGHYQKDRFAKPEDLLHGNCDFKKEGVMTNKENELKKKTYEQEYFT